MASLEINYGMSIMRYFCTTCSFETDSFWKAVFHNVIHLYKVRKGERCDSTYNFPIEKGYMCHLKKDHSGMHVSGSYEWSNTEEELKRREYDRIFTAK